MEIQKVCVWIMLNFQFCSCQLVVNVRNGGGEVYKEVIEANTTQDTIVLEFKLADGTIINQFIDAKNELQIFKVSILPEEDLAQNDVQHLCFLLRFSKQEFISADAMSKLRQKNPSAIRHPEEEGQWEHFSMDILINTSAFSIISPHIPRVCAAAPNSSYSRHSDMKLVSQILNKNFSHLESSVTVLPGIKDNWCSKVRKSGQPCYCQYDVCTGWYPCGLKYCRGKDSSNKVVNYRCGIKTCSKCRSFDYYASGHTFCNWNTDTVAELDNGIYSHRSHAFSDGLFTVNPHKPKGEGV